jgi:two-component system, OmpR family, manganese sensing sensor histidine kinase
LFQTTRRKLALWYSLITAVVLILFAIGVFFYVRSTLIERIDDTLNHIVEVVMRSIAINQQGQIDVAESFHNNAADLEDDHIDLELFDLQGQLLWSTWVEPLLLPLRLKAESSGQTVTIDAQHLLRQIVQPVRFHGHILGWLRVSHPWFEVTKPIQELFLDLLTGTTVTIGILAGVGWFLSGLAIEPVKASYQQLKQFTADASHELRNPLATIQTNVQVALATGQQLPIAQQNHLQVIERLTRRLGKLVDDLLFLARQDSGDTPIVQEVVPLDALLMEVVEEQQLAAQAQGVCLKLAIADAPTAFDIEGDWDQLARLFTNLIDNAIQYSPTQQTITPLVEVAIDRSEANIQVQVTDQGMGIAADDLPRIMNRFYRVNPARSGAQSGGSGLGLAIVQSITQRHHGQIAINSVVQQGTKVLVTFPLAKTSQS